MADISQREVTEAFKDALRWGRSEGIFGGGSGGGGGGSAPSSPGGSSPIAKTLTEEGKGLGNSFVAVGKAGLDVADKLLTGGARVSDYTKALRDNFSSLGSGSSVLGKGFAEATELLDKLGSNLDQNVDLWRRLADSGASFGNDIIAMKEQASNARMTLAEMSEVVSKNTTNLAGLGPTVSQSMAAFSKVSKEMYDSGAGEQLRSMGYTTKELNDVLAVSLSNRRITDLKDEASRKKAYESAASLATEMDAVAKITGQSKQQQLDELRRREADGQRQAAIDLAIQKGGAGAKEAFDILETTSKAGGTSFQKLAQDIATMKRPSEGMEETYALMGPEAQKLLQKAGEAARAGNEKAAKEYTEAALEARTNFQKTGTFMNLAAQGVKSASDAYGENGPLRKAMDAAGGSMKNLKKEVDDAQKGVEKSAIGDDEGKTISKESTRAITQFAVDVESRGRDLTKVLTNEVIKPLADPVGKRLAELSKSMSLGSPKAVAEIETGMRTGRVKYQANDAVQENVRAAGGIREGDKAYPELVKLTQLLGSQATKEKANAELNKIAESQGKNVKEVIDAAMKDKGAGLADLNKQLSSKLTEEEIKKAQTEKAETEKRVREGKQGTPALDFAKEKQPSVAESVGTGVGALGSLFTPSQPGYVSITNLRDIPGRAVGGYVEKPSLSYLAENGPEFVLNQPQMKSLIEGIGGQGIDISKISKDMEGFGNTKSQGIDISKIGKDIATSISSVSSGASTISSTGPSSKADQAQAAIDEAISAKDKALAEFNRMLNEGSDDELDASYEVFLKAKENLEKVIDDSIGDLTGSFNDFGDNWDDSLDQISTDIKDAIPFDDISDNWLDSFDKIGADIKDAIPFDEFSGLDEAIAKQKSLSDMGEFAGVDEAIAKQQATTETPDVGKIDDTAKNNASSKLNLSNLAFGPNGMPMFKQVEAAKQTLPDKSPEKVAEEKARQKEAAEKTAAASKEKDTKSSPTAPATKSASLDDAVKQLIQLNKLMSQFVDDHKDLGTKQIRAAKSSSANINERV